MSAPADRIRPVLQAISTAFPHKDTHDAIAALAELERERDELRAKLTQTEQIVKDSVFRLYDQADRIAALEAEKAERDAQEPVAWAWNDALGCMHAHCGSGRPVWVDGECSDAKRAETSLRPLYAAPPVPRVDPDWLSNVIRTVDGNHTMGAGVLAEKIAEAINGRRLNERETNTGTIQAGRVYW